MKKDESGKKTTVGCLVIAALFFVVLGICQCNEEQQERQPMPEREITPSISAPLMKAEPVRPKTKSVTTTFTKMDDEDTDDDPYDNPDFDDLIPGEEYDEEFVDRSEGDPELYDKDS